MATARDIITGALRLIGVASEAETPSAYQITTGLEALNELVDQWNAEQNTVFYQKTVSAIVPAGSQSFTIGPGGLIDVPSRPAVIIAASAQTQNDSSSYNLSVISGTDWIQINDKTSSSTRPSCIYLDGSWPIATVKLFPVPTESVQIEILCNHTIDPGMTLDTSITFPPAFAQALRFNLALVLAPEYGREVLPTVERQAIKAKHSITMSSTQVERLDGQKSANWYDIDTD